MNEVPNRILELTGSLVSESIKVNPRRFLLYPPAML